MKGITQIIKAHGVTEYCTDKSLPYGRKISILKVPRYYVMAGTGDDNTGVIKDFPSLVMALEWLESYTRPTHALDVHTMLLVVGVTLSEEVIAAWTQEQKDQVFDWASKLHLYASDNNVRVPKVPEWLHEIAEQMEAAS